MRLSLEIRFHGRGGQGVVTSAELLAVAAGKQGLWSSAFPIYGAERRGAEIEAYCRISDQPIRLTSPIENPDIIVIIDPTLLNISNPLRGLKREGKVLINAKNANIPFTTFAIDAYKIARDIGLVKSGWPMVNVIMLGALARIINLSLTSLNEAIDEEFEGKSAELNKRGAEIAYKIVSEVYQLAV
ncbi:2-oxoacid:acceptor oxidoreductase family protein [Acidianus sp. HS-5]|uniref:2-oxoacid:acceptor oxidoreductase family protein n=1 Tax=Acidianus sp. HS-5 TaxID=2886040 RepID=UPI001F424319|nr:2-oxoacid:acceptor oxidoreductase family protein [Acidianus sp. HS-5]BDC17604.1 pyruvate synthase [Acidianus sp. HS-5]